MDTFMGTSEQTIKLDVFETSSGPIWYVIYSGEIMASDRIAGVGVRYLRRESPVGDIDLATNRVENVDGVTEAPSLVYWERQPKSNPSDRVLHKAVSGTIGLERVGDGLRLVLRALKFLPAHEKQPESEIVVTEGAIEPSMVWDGEISGRFEWSCTNVEGPDEELSSDFCIESASDLML
jgi:hypothetical protein